MRRRRGSNPTGELSEALEYSAGTRAVDQIDGFEVPDIQGLRRGVTHPVLAGHFLVDRDGIVRWSSVESGAEAWAGSGKFPTDGEILAVARGL